MSSAFGFALEPLTINSAKQTRATTNPPAGVDIELIKARSLSSAMWKFRYAVAMGFSMCTNKLVPKNAIQPNRKMSLALSGNGCGDANFDAENARAAADTPHPRPAARNIKRYALLSVCLLPFENNIASCGPSNRGTKYRNGTRYSMCIRPKFRSARSAISVEKYI
jgi:hypothetical protein